MKNTKNIKGLSDSELDDLIEYGIQQGENVQRHSDEYQHWLEVVAQAKEEKASRGSDVPDGGTTKLASVSDSVEEREAPRGKIVKGQKKRTVETPDGMVVNEGLPGVEPGMAETTPENEQ